MTNITKKDLKTLPDGGTIRAASFSSMKGVKKGYDEDEVDALLNSTLAEQERLFKVVEQSIKQAELVQVEPQVPVIPIIQDTPMVQSIPMIDEVDPIPEMVEVRDYPSQKEDADGIAYLLKVAKKEAHEAKLLLTSAEKTRNETFGASEKVRSEIADLQAAKRDFLEKYAALETTNESSVETNEIFLKEKEEYDAWRLAAHSDTERHRSARRMVVDRTVKERMDQAGRDGETLRRDYEAELAEVEKLSEDFTERTSYLINKKNDLTQRIIRITQEKERLQKEAKLALTKNLACLEAISTTKLESLDELPENISDNLYYTKSVSRSESSN